MLRESRYERFTRREFAFYILRWKMEKDRSEIMQMMKIKKRQYYRLRAKAIEVIDPYREYSRYQDKKVKKRLASAQNTGDSSGNYF